jgi:hypothetical protein
LIDWDDAGDAAMFSWFFDGPIGLIFTLLAIILMFYACENEKECSARACPNGQQAKLMAHECLCVQKAE